MMRETPRVDGADGARTPRYKRWSTQLKKRFLKTLAETLNVSEAARAVQMDRARAYALKDRDPAFARGWRDALDQAYGEVEVLLLQQSRDGSVRTETVRNEATGEVRQTKTVHSYPLGVASRLLLSHKDEVAAHRAMLAQTEADADTINRVRAQMDAVRARMAARADAKTEAGDDLQDDDD